MDVLLFLWILCVTASFGNGLSPVDKISPLQVETGNASNVCRVLEGDLVSGINISQHDINIVATVGSSDNNCTTIQCSVASMQVTINVTICREENIITTSSVSSATHSSYSTPKSCDCDLTSPTNSKHTSYSGTYGTTEAGDSSSLKPNNDAKIQTFNTGFEDTYSRTTVMTVGVCSFIGGVISVILVAVAHDRLRHRSCKVRCRKQARTASPEDSRSLQDSQVAEFQTDTDIRSYDTLDKTEQRDKRLERKKKRKRNKETSVGKTRGMQPCTIMEPHQRNNAKVYELSAALPSDDHIYEGVHSCTNLDELEHARIRVSDISEDHPYWILEKLKRAESDFETDKNSAMHECTGIGTAELMQSQENDRDSKYSLSSKHDYWILEKVKRVSQSEREETLEPTEDGAEKVEAESKEDYSDCTEDEDHPNWNLAGEQEVENEENKDGLYTQTEILKETFAEDQLKLSLQKEAEKMKTNTTF